MSSSTGLVLFGFRNLHHIFATQMMMMICGVELWAATTTAKPQAFRFTTTIDRLRCCFVLPSNLDFPPVITDRRCFVDVL
jgi:hypothetical protein